MDQTIVDVTTPDLGRDVRLLEEVSRMSDATIIAATGTWIEIPRVFEGRDPDEIARLYVREIEQGMDGTVIRAGVIKVANNEFELTPRQEVVLRAAARASIQTGVPITTHTRSVDRVGEAQLKIFVEEGVDLAKVCIGHSNDTTDLGYLSGLIDRGAYIGMDHYPGGLFDDGPNWEERTQTIARLVERGYGERIMVSHDWAFSMGGPQLRARMQESNPDGNLFITRKVLPLMQSIGIPTGTIDAMTVDNPRRYFGG